MKISVSVTTYNGEKFIVEQLNSILSQSRKADRVVICDDCSTDSTAKIVTSFIAEKGLENFEFSVNSERLGYVKNFAKSLSKCGGDIVFLCDQDDIWNKEKIEKITDKFSNKAVLGVNSSFRLADSSGKEIIRKSGGSNNGLIGYKLHNSFERIPFSTVMKTNISPGCTTAFCREIIDEYLNSSVFKLAHDWELNLIAAAKGGLYFLDEKLMSYRLHENNTTGLRTASSLKMSGSDDKRKSVLKQQQALYEVLERYESHACACDKPFLKNYKRFIDNREKIVEKRSTLSAVKNLWLMPSLAEPKRSFAGDIIYSLKKERR